MKLGAKLAILSLLSLSILSLPSSSSSATTNQSATCPMDLGYVYRISWPVSDCQSYNPAMPGGDNSSRTRCCQTLSALYGVAFSRHLKETSVFLLPDLSTSAACLADFDSKLASLSNLPSNLTSVCFDPLQFVISPNICAAIESTRDWLAKLGPSTALDSGCRPNLTDLTSCDACVAAGFRVQAALIAIDGNKSHSTNCFYFTIMYAAGIVNEFGPESSGAVSCILGILIRSQSGAGKTHSSLVYGLAGAGGAVLVMSVLLGVYVWWDQKWRRKRKNNAGPVASVCILALPSLFCYLKRNCCGKGNSRKSKDGINQGMHSLMYELKNKVAKFDNKHNHWKEDLELPFFLFSSIRIATDDFSYANKIGQGGFGPVYKDKLDNGQEIAVKRLIKNSQQGLEEFKNEVILISKLQHRNLVRLLGCCIQEDERILIYEYMPNKSLDLFIFGVERRALLDWKMRASIIEGIAQGLLYLHKYSRLRIIHRDLKTSNILLDNNMSPRISDFGTARIFGDNESQANTNRIIGTYGYMSPEYALDGLFSVKSDIFSFGVMILEIISGKKSAGFYQLDRALNLLGYAWDLWNEGKGLEIMDDVLVETYSTTEILRYIQVGFLCVQQSPADRPIISEVLSILSNEMIAIPTPRQPAFSTIVSAYHASTPEIPKPCSLNDITILEEGG